MDQIYRIVVSITMMYFLPAWTSTASKIDSDNLSSALVQIDLVVVIIGFFSISIMRMIDLLVERRFSNMILGFDHFDYIAKSRFIFLMVSFYAIIILMISKLVVYRTSNLIICMHHAKATLYVLLYVSYLLHVGMPSVTNNFKKVTILIAISGLISSTRLIFEDGVVRNIFLYSSLSIYIFVFIILSMKLSSWMVTCHSTGCSSLQNRNFSLYLFSCLSFLLCHILISPDIGFLSGYMSLSVNMTLYLSMDCIIIVFTSWLHGWMCRGDFINATAGSDMKRMIVRYVSHEVRTPLNIISIGLSLLVRDMERKKYDPDDIRNAKEVLDTTDIAVNILDDMLTYDKLEGGHMKMNFTDEVVYLFVMEAVKPFFVQARHAGIILSVSASRDSRAVLNKCQFTIDKSKMNQVVRNLLSNALKFTPKGGKVAVEVSFVKKCVSTKQQYATAGAAAFDEEYVQLRILDTGVGISKDNQSRLFGEVIQFNAGVLENGQGAGLGLFIAKGIVELHGGSIGVFSEGEGHGSTFFVNLPCKRVSSELENTITDRVDISEIITPLNFLAPLSTTSNSTQSKEFNSASYKRSRTESYNIVGNIMRRLSNNAGSTRIVCNEYAVDKSNDIDTFSDNSSAGDEFMSGSTHSHGTANLSSIRNLCVLVIDKDTNRSKLIKKSLRRRTENCTCVTDGMDALELIRDTMIETEKSFDVVFVAPLLDDADGPTTVEVIRHIGYMGTIIGISNNSLGSLEEARFLTHGADRVISPPFISSGLQSLIEEIHLKQSVVSSIARRYLNINTVSGRHLVSNQMGPANDHLSSRETLISPRGTGTGAVAVGTGVGVVVSPRLPASNNNHTLRDEMLRKFSVRNITSGSRKIDKLNKDDSKNIRVYSGKDLKPAAGRADEANVIEEKEKDQEDNVSQVPLDEYGDGDEKSDGNYSNMDTNDFNGFTKVNNNMNSLGTAAVKGTGTGIGLSPSSHMKRNSKENLRRPSARLELEDMSSYQSNRCSMDMDAEYTNSGMMSSLSGNDFYGGMTSPVDSESAVKSPLTNFSFVNEVSAAPSLHAMDKCHVTQVNSVCESCPNKLNILIVDDDGLCRKMMSRLLQNKANISEAEDGAVAVEKVKQAIKKGLTYDVVLMDYQMPNMDGPTASKHMRSLGFTAPIIGVTGNAVPCDIETFLREGANKVMMKPLRRLEEFEMVLRECITTADVKKLSSPSKIEYFLKSNMLM